MIGPPDICLPSPFIEIYRKVNIYTQIVCQAGGSWNGNEMGDLYWSRHDLIRFCASDEVYRE